MGRERRQALAESLNRIMRPDDRTFLATAASRTTLLPDLTDSVAELRRGTGRIPAAQLAAAHYAFWPSVCPAWAAQKALT